MNTEASTNTATNLGRLIVRTVLLITIADSDWQGAKFNYGGWGYQGCETLMKLRLFGRITSFF